jgi:hypothetical protein
LSCISISNKKAFIFVIFLISFSKLFTLENDLNNFSNISIYTKIPSDNWIFSVDLLAWYPSEEVASIFADVITVGNNTSAWEAKGFNFKWDYGFRLAAGYNWIYDKWDTTLYWTWFRSDAKDSIPHQQNASISPEFYAAFLSGDTPQNMSVKWSLFFNMFDLELGKKHWISRKLFLRPFLGIKGGWINQSIDAKYFNLTINNVLTNNVGNEHLKNNFWGIGPIGGINTKWRIGSFGNNFLDLFGDFSTATMWGEWINKDVYKNTALQTSSVNIKNSNLGALMFRGFMGFEWNKSFDENKSQVTTKLGYEMQIWLNQLRFATFQLQRLHHDLTFQGVTFNCRFDF